MCELDSLSNLSGEGLKDALKAAITELSDDERAALLEWIKATIT